MLKRAARLALMRLEDRWTPAAGDLDLSFGTGGVVVLPTLPKSGSTFLRPPDPSAATIGPDGRIVVVGTYQTHGPAAFRLMSDGQLDPTFGDGGMVSIESRVGFVFGITAVAVQPDGRPVLVGYGVPPADGNQYRFLAIRLTADGRLDPTFDGDGQAYVSFSPALTGVDFATAVAIQPDGRIVIAGGAKGPVTSQSFAAARLTPDGQLDPTFGEGGKVTVPFPVGQYSRASANAVTVQPDGRIILAGGTATNSGPREVIHVGTTTEYFTDFAAVRLTADGAIDTGFGDGGRVRIPFDLGGNNSDEARAVGVRPDGRIVLAGTGVNSPRSTIGYAVARLTATGVLDPTFDGDGKASGPTISGVSVAVRPDGRAVFAGMNEVTQTATNGRPDPAFGTGGRAPIGVYVPNAGITYQAGLAVQPDGGIILAGRRVDGLVARLTGTGSADATTGVLVGGPADGTARLLRPTGTGFDPPATLNFFTDHPGTVRTAVADVTGDGVPDMIGGTGPGADSAVSIFDGKTGARLADLQAFETTFTGGVYVTAADLDGDGKAEVIVTPDQGGGPAVVVYDGAGLTAGRNEGAERTRFFGIDDPDFRGGARAAAGDVDGNGRMDLVVAAGFGGGPRVAVYDDVGLFGGVPARLVPDFFVFEETLRNGVFVTAGDLNADGAAELVFGGGPGGGPLVFALDGRALAGGTQTTAANFFAGDSTSRGGVHVSVRTDLVNGQTVPRIVTGSGEGEAARVRVYDAATATAGSGPERELTPFDGATLTDGVFVG